MRLLIEFIQSRLKAISGSQRAKRLRARLQRSDFILKSAAAGFALGILLLVAIADFVVTATQKDQQVQESVLRGQLAEFLLATRDPEGVSLLENSSEFTKARRPVQVVNLRRPFFNYFLTKANLRTFRTEDQRWDPPRSCVVEFAPAAELGNAGLSHSFSIQACFAAIPSDAAGRYVYFYLRYPSASIQRHQRGRPASESDRLLLRFVGQRETRLFVTFEAPPLPKVSRRAQLQRFDGLHELTGFLSDDGGRVTRYLSGQAYERRGDGLASAEQSFITIRGRIDASMFSGLDDGTSEWPTKAIKGLAIGVEVLSARDGAKEQGPSFGFAPREEGTALVSLEQAYRATILSKANLAISMGGGPGAPQVIWQSIKDLAPLPLETGWAQALSDWMAKSIQYIGAIRTPPVTVRQQQNVSGVPPISAVLVTEPILLPDIATRAFAWLIVLFIMLVTLLTILGGAFLRLDRLTRSARAIRGPHGIDQLAEYAHSQDQIGRLGRVLHALRKSDNARITRHMKRLQREEAIRIEAMQHEEDRLRNREGILDAIGHEIRSPLQSLLNTIRRDSDHYEKLERMRRAVDALYEATAVEDGLRSGQIVVETLDIGDYLSRCATNFSWDGKPVVFVGQPNGVIAVFDPVALAQILSHLIDNAMRYRDPGSNIELRLRMLDSKPVVEVFNRGPHIAEAGLDAIFNLGVSDQGLPGNKGQGLFAARCLSVGMRAHLRAENQPGGVAFVITLPPPTPV